MHQHDLDITKPYHDLMQHDWESDGAMGCIKYWAGNDMTLSHDAMTAKARAGLFGLCTAMALHAVAILHLLVKYMTSVAGGLHTADLA